jgi:hypothetical protein
MGHLRTRAHARGQRVAGLSIVEKGARDYTLVGVRWQLELENRASLDGPCYPNMTVVALDDRTANGKANSHANYFSREHRFENMVLVGRIDACAGILDGYMNKIWFVNAGSYAQHTRLYRLHRLNGIHDQI